MYVYAFCILYYVQEELTDRSEERDGSSDQQVEEGGDQAVDMSEEFGGDVTDLPEARDSDNESEG